MTHVDDVFIFLGAPRSGGHVLTSPAQPYLALLPAPLSPQGWV